jgi:hypothetical protein
MGDFTKVFAALVGAVILFTLMTGGKFSLGTSPTGPSFAVGFQGPG